VHSALPCCRVVCAMYCNNSGLWPLSDQSGSRCPVSDALLLLLLLLLLHAYCRCLSALRMAHVVPQCPLSGRVSLPGGKR
jgi:hypothetical protein